MLVGGAVATNSSRLVSSAEAVIVSATPARFVSRGGEKLDAALAQFDLDVRGRRAIDVGSSTGGFTDCLLQRGAASVVALDVGRGQLDQRLRRDERVTVWERTNVRHVAADAIGAPFDVVVTDVSFISIRTVAPRLAGDLAAVGAELVILVKPQFEASRAAASRGKGVIREPETWADALRGASGALIKHGAAMMAVMPSPITGADGNVEFLVHARAHTPVGEGLGPGSQWAAAIDVAVDASAARR